MKFSYQEDVEIRVLEEASYFVSEKSTVRKTAEHFNRSKSTIHKDLTERLPQFSSFLSNKVWKILDTNKKERSIRGGNATKQKFLKMKGGAN